MDRENQNVEWKESWRDDYLKWICGFANSGGGLLFIGKDNKGNVLGIKNVEKLLVDLPNKIRDILGIIVDINLRDECGKEFIEIIVESNISPVSYKGNYYYRSGSTLQELRGSVLEKFLLGKIGKKWDGILMDFPKQEMDNSSFNIFREKSSQINRIPKSELKDSNMQLLKKLHLLENVRIKRAGILLFYRDTEMLFTGAYLKIGFFKSDGDLLFHNEVHGSLFQQIEKAIDLLFTKYFKETIKYKRASRMEKLPYPESSIREALLNALIHKDYSSRVPVQISVYNDKIIFWNPGSLPKNWTVDVLYKKHPSIPPNPDIANTFFRAGYIEAWGRGTIKLIEECKIYNLPKPVFEADGVGITVIIRQDIINREILEEIGFDDNFIKILIYVKQKGNITNSEVQNLCDVSKATATRYLNQLEKEFIKRTGKTGRGTKYELKDSQRAQKIAKGFTKGSK